MIVNSFASLNLEINPNQDFQDLQRQWFKLFAVINIIAIAGAWLGEATLLHRVTWIDQTAYIVLLGCLCGAIALIQWRPHTYTLVLYSILTVAIIFVNVDMQIYIWHDTFPENLYDLGAISQWLPYIYISLFLFLPRLRALVVSTLIYLSIASSGIIHGWVERDLAVTAQKLPLLWQIMMAHPYYIAIFMVVATLQRSFISARVQAGQANIDVLTTLANRRAATRLLSTYLEAKPLTLGIILMDIDCFKQINDTLGHDVGDQVLVAIGSLLHHTHKELLAPADLVARWGGEEFLLIVTNTHADALYHHAEGLRQRLADYTHPMGGQVTASFGVAIAEAGDQLETLVRRADQALYQAKQQGRNCVVVATPQPCADAETV